MYTLYARTRNKTLRARLKEENKKTGKKNRIFYTYLKAERDALVEERRREERETTRNKRNGGFCQGRASPVITIIIVVVVVKIVIIRFRFDELENVAF